MTAITITLHNESMNLALALLVPLVSFISPNPNQTISGSKVATSIAVTNFAIVDYKTHPRLVPGQGHLHLWMDQKDLTKTSAVKATSDTYTFENVKPGTHTLVAELVANNHSSLVPAATPSVTFTTTSPSTPTAQLSPLILSITAFLSLVLALYFVSTVKPKSGTSPRKSSKKSSKRRSRK